MSMNRAISTDIMVIEMRDPYAGEIEQWVSIVSRTCFGQITRHLPRNSISGAPETRSCRSLLIVSGSDSMLGFPEGSIKMRQPGIYKRHAAI